MNCIKTVRTPCQNCAKMTLFRQKLILTLISDKINIKIENSVSAENLTLFPDLDICGDIAS
jgi:hypothetical protein